MEAREELRKLRESTGMNRKQFCEYFEIPYMTETDWELGNRRVPQYLLRLIAYEIQMEKLSDKRSEGGNEDAFFIEMDKQMYEMKERRKANVVV
jgi:transcriptional regulator with XRE-family HTH domain